LVVIVVFNINFLTITKIIIIATKATKANKNVPIFLSILVDSIPISENVPLIVLLVNLKNLSRILSEGISLKLTKSYIVVQNNFALDG
jgi:hypothetical protein